MGVSVARSEIQFTQALVSGTVSTFLATLLLVCTRRCCDSSGGRLSAPGRAGGGDSAALSWGQWRGGQGAHTCPDPWMELICPMSLTASGRGSEPLCSRLSSSPQGGRFLADSTGKTRADPHLGMRDLANPVPASGRSGSLCQVKSGPFGVLVHDPRAACWSWTRVTLGDVQQAFLGLQLEGGVCWGAQGRTCGLHTPDPEWPPHILPIPAGPSGQRREQGSARWSGWPQATELFGGKGTVSPSLSVLSDEPGHLPGRVKVRDEGRSRSLEQCSSCLCPNPDPVLIGILIIQGYRRETCLPHDVASAAIAHNRINEAWSLAIQKLFKDA